MQAKRILKTQINSNQLNLKNQTLSRQIETLREVLRRVPANNSSSVESLINHKLKDIK